MGRLHMKPVNCEFQEYARRLTEQFINGRDDEVIIEGIIRELTALKDTSEVSSDQVLMWTGRMEAQREKKGFWTI